MYSIWSFPSLSWMDMAIWRRNVNFQDKKCHLVANSNVQNIWKSNQLQTSTMSTSVPKIKILSQRVTVLLLTQRVHCSLHDGTSDSIIVPEFFEHYKNLFSNTSNIKGTVQSKLKKIHIVAVSAIYPFRSVLEWIADFWVIIGCKDVCLLCFTRGAQNAKLKPKQIALLWLL